MILDRVLSWFGADKITDGRVVKKTHYPATLVTGTTGQVVGNKFVTTTYSTSIESWSLSVRGIGKFGGLVTQECYVDEMTWNNTEIGDKYGVLHH